MTADLALWLALYFGAERVREVRTRERDEDGFRIYRLEDVPESELRERTPMVTFRADDGQMSMRCLTWAEIAAAVDQYLSGQDAE